MIHQGDVHLVVRQGQQLGLVHEFGGETQHMHGESGGKHVGGHAALRQIAAYFLHVRIKADGQHAVGLVKDQAAQMFQTQGAAQQMVQHPARRADNHLSAAAQGFQLRAVAHPAVQGGGVHGRAFKQDFGLMGHLQGQFAGGHQNEGLGRVGLAVHGLQQGQQKCPGFAAAGAGLDHQIAPGQTVGQGHGLHGHKLGPAHTAQGIAHHFG